MRHYILLTASLMVFHFTAYAQQDDNHPTEEDYRHDSADYQYDYEHTYHYEHGPWGYRAEAQLMDSLAILEMMGEASAEEVRQAQEQFRRTKAEKQREQKQKLRDERQKKQKGKPPRN